jgi:hypothetical protein
MRSLWLLLSLLLCLPAPALAQDDGDDVLDEEDDVDPDVDDQEIYDSFKAELQGDPASEEIDAWNRYLEAYPKSMFRLQIERRIAALEDAAHDELLQEEAREAKREAERVDAKRAELEVPQPALLSVNPNPQRRVNAGLLWGYNNVLNYDLGFEWAFLRKFSAWGAIRHVGAGGGDLGLTAQIGAKYALIKDVRTGIVLSGYVAIQPGYSQADNFLFTVTPGVGFAYAKTRFFQLSTTLQIDLQLTAFRTVVWWDIQAVINPSQVVGIYLESKQKHGIFTTAGNNVPSATDYLAFYQAGVGVKIRPNEVMELTVGANIPYFWRIWKDYRYVGIHGGVVFNLPGKPKK